MRYDCEEWFGAKWTIHTEIKDPPEKGSNTPRMGVERPSLTIAKHNMQVWFDAKELLPGLGVRIGSTRARDAANFISQTDADGRHETRLVEVPVIGEFGRAYRQDFTSRFFYKIGDTPDETCVIAAIGEHTPAIRAFEKGFLACEGLSNSSPRLRASHFQMAAAGEKRVKALREKLLNDMPSCKDVSAESLRRDALDFPEWPEPKGPLKGDYYWRLSNCDKELGAQRGGHGSARR